MWFFKPSVSAQSIAKAFLHEPLTIIDIQGFGISTLGLEWNGLRIIITWYSTNRLRSISIDGESFMGNGRDANHIFKAAFRRARNLLDERLTELDEKAKKVQKNSK